MPEHKRQHYVPRCYLKPFSLNGGGAAINLYNILNSRTIRNASLKGQCARDYLYGSDLEIERELQYFEGEYARILRVLQSNKEHLTSEEMDWLRGFALLQYSRTDMAMRRMRMMREGMHNAIYEGRPINPPDLDLSDRKMMLEAMFLYARMHEEIDDLRTCIVENRTSIDFITSDDPAVFSSRFYIQKQHSRKFGLGSSGATFFLPLSPRFLLICYDSDVYSISGLSGGFVSTKNPRDVRALNELQYLKAAENIYFSDWDERQDVEREFLKHSTNRPDDWCSLSVFVKDGVTEKGEHYRLATEEEKKTARETTVMLSSLHPEPSMWFSKQKFRSHLKTYSNGSAAGHVRRMIWDKRGLSKN